MRRERDVVRAELGARDLEHHADDALADLRRGRVDDGAAVGAEHDAGGAEVVEAFRVADVLEPEREPDAASNALAVRRVAGAAGQAERVAGQRLGLGNGQGRGAQDDLARRQRAGDDLSGGQDVARLERVQQPQLDGVDPELLGEQVHLRLAREAGLHSAEAAHRAARRVVRVDRRRLDQRVVDPVGPERERGGVRRDRGRARRVRAAVEQDPHPDARQAALARGAVLAPDPRRMSVDVAGERLGAVVDHLHGPVGVEREQRPVDLHREVLASAERAAHAGEVDPHLLGLEAEAGRDLVAVDMQPLRRDVDVDTALAVRDGEPRLGPEERLILDAELVDAAHDDVAGRVGIAVPDHHVPHDVRPRIVAVAVAHRRAVGMQRLLHERALHVDDRLERLVLDHDRGQRLLRLLGMLRRDHDRPARRRSARGRSRAPAGRRTRGRRASCPERRRG